MKAATQSNAVLGLSQLPSGAFDLSGIKRRLARGVRAVLAPTQAVAAVVDLSKHEAHRLDGWALAKLKGQQQDPQAVVGHCVAFGMGGQTTAIVGYDPKSHRVITKSGSVYALGVAMGDFSQKHPDLMIELGFRKAA